MKINETIKLLEGIRDAPESVKKLIHSTLASELTEAKVETVAKVSKVRVKPVKNFADESINLIKGIIDNSDVPLTAAEIAVNQTKLKTGSVKGILSYLGKNKLVSTIKVPGKSAYIYSKKP